MSPPWAVGKGTPGLGTAELWEEYVLRRQAEPGILALLFTSCDLENGVLPSLFHHLENGDNNFLLVKRQAHGAAVSDVPL